jgi:hypothetical protein
MTQLWSFDDNFYPPQPTSSNNELYDLDIVTYRLLAYYQGVLQANFISRWQAVTQALQLTSANVNYLVDGYVVPQAIAYPVTSTLLSTDYKFPLLSCYRKDEKWTQQSIQWINVESNYLITLVMPPLTNPQLARLYHFLAAFSKCILKSTFFQSDPLYNNGELVFAEADSSFILAKGAEYGSLLGQDGKTYFPSLQVHVTVAERTNFVSSNYSEFTGFDITDSLIDGYQPGNPISPFSQATLNPNITITSITPNTSPLSGNQVCLLQGAGFTSNIVAISLAGVPVTKFIVKSPQTILAISAGSPAITNGDVTVTDNRGNIYTLTGAFSYA